MFPKDRVLSGCSGAKGGSLSPKSVQNTGTQPNDQEHFYLVTMWRFLHRFHLVFEFMICGNKHRVTSQANHLLNLAWSLTKKIPLVWEIPGIVWLMMSQLDGDFYQASYEDWLLISHPAGCTPCSCLSMHTNPQYHRWGRSHDSLAFLNGF